MKTGSLLSIRKVAKGFTIVELLIVVVILAILVSISILSYTGMIERANITAIQADLSSASTKLKMYSMNYGHYPDTLDANNCPLTPEADGGYCISVSDGGSVEYGSVEDLTFHLSIARNSLSYSITDRTPPAVTTTEPNSTIGKPCPQGFIPVPGSGTYETDDFCVMKYEAKIQGNDNGTQAYDAAFVPESRASGTPWGNISQTEALLEAQTACTGCHLISDAQWMTIAQNVMSVTANWDDGSGNHAFGQGSIYVGHSDNSPASLLNASNDDSDAYLGTGNVAPSNQKRVLYLSNGETIWDLAGNSREWTSGQIANGKAGVPGYNGWLDWNNASMIAGDLEVNPFPEYANPKAHGWNYSKGIGRLFSNADSATPVGILRGGNYNSSGNIYSGIFTLYLNSPTDNIGPNIGFRAVR